MVRGGDGGARGGRLQPARRKGVRPALPRARGRGLDAGGAGEHAKRTGRSICRPTRSTPPSTRRPRSAIWRPAGASTPRWRSCRSARSGACATATLAQRYAAMPSEPRPPVVGSPSTCAAGQRAYPDIWRQDLIEWELGGDPSACSRGTSPSTPRRTSTLAPALLALLLCSDPGFSHGEREGGGRARRWRWAGVQIYEVLSPLERLFEHPAPEVRAAVMGGVSPRLRGPHPMASSARGSCDPAPSVVEEALQRAADRRLRRRARSGEAHLSRVGRASGCGWPRSRGSATIAHAGGGVGAHRGGPSGDRAPCAWPPRRSWQEVERRREGVTLIRQARDAEIGDRREILDRVLRALR